MQKLVIIESPGKIGTISSALGKDYKVIASVGHVRDLPVSTLGVDVKNGYKPKYISIKGKSTIINQLKKEIKKVDKVYLATDPDREGEAISWHLTQVLGLDDDKYERLTFNEITRNAILEGISNARKIDMNLVDSQQARRILDRIVGYELSPYLWKTVKRGLSAGRVQSVATKIIKERDEQINSFVSEEYWTITCDLDNNGKTMKVHYYGSNGKEKTINNENDANKIYNDVISKDFILEKINEEVKNKSPYPPFITSTLQQEASRKLNFQTKKTMKVAQELYEGVNMGKESHGLITYMRTDSLRISNEAIYQAKKYITETYGDKYYPSKTRVFKTKTSSQDAHEAIRPTNVFLTPESIKDKLTSDQYKLYKLIWTRFVASQMQIAKILTVQFDFKCNNHNFKANEYKLKQDGYMKLYSDDEYNISKNITKLEENDKLKCKDCDMHKNFTLPPPHYTEGTLIKALDEKGIGRPSTYSSTIQTIIERGYVKREKKDLIATDLGYATVNIMDKSFPKYVDYKFTAKMEDELDNIANGDNTMESVLDEFYTDFSENLELANKKIEENKVEYQVEEAGFNCEVCGKPMIIKKSKFGYFAGCSDYPNCKHTVSLDKNKKVIEKKETSEVLETEQICPDCGGKLVVRTGKTGKFYACSNYPKCKYTKSIPVHIGVKCPICGGEIEQRKSVKGKLYYSCENYPKCNFSTYDKPTNEVCPKCGKMMMLTYFEKYLSCSGCDYKIENKK